MQAHANFTYPIPEMDLLNALDDAALEQIIFAETESDFEVYIDHPSNTVSIKLRKALKPFASTFKSKGSVFLFLGSTSLYSFFWRN